MKVEEYARGNVYVTTALLDLYAKCGSIRRAWQQVFQGIGRRRDMSSSNTLPCSYVVSVCLAPMSSLVCLAPMSSQYALLICH